MSKLDNMKRILCALAVLAGMAAALAQQRPDTPAWRLQSASEAEQVAAVNAALDRGLPPDDGIGVLAHNKPSLVLPLIEQRIEQVLRSRTPLDCFADKTVNPSNFVTFASLWIADTGSEQALVEIAKLMKFDERRFSPLVEGVLIQSSSYSKSRNPFVVAYGGLAIGDPAVDTRILAWAQKNLSVDPEERARAEKAARGYFPKPPPPAEEMKHFWAKAMVDRYHGVPTEEQWASDPIASRLSGSLAESLREEVFRFAREAISKSPARP